MKRTNSLKEAREIAPHPDAGSDEYNNLMTWQNGQVAAENLAQCSYMRIHRTIIPLEQFPHKQRPKRWWLASCRYTVRREMTHSKDVTYFTVRFRIPTLGLQLAQRGVPVYQPAHRTSVQSSDNREMSCIALVCNAAPT